MSSPVRPTSSSTLPSTSASRMFGVSPNTSTASSRSATLPIRLTVKLSVSSTLTTLGTSDRTTTWPGPIVTSGECAIRISVDVPAVKVMARKFGYRSPVPGTGLPSAPACSVPGTSSRLFNSRPTTFSKASAPSGVRSILIAGNSGVEVADSSRVSEVVVAAPASSGVDVA